jgi:hypothetical protein
VITKQTFGWKVEYAVILALLACAPFCCPYK